MISDVDDGAQRAGGTHEVAMALAFVNGDPTTPAFAPPRAEHSLPWLHELGREARALRLAGIALLEAHVRGSRPSGPPLRVLDRALGAARWEKRIDQDEAGVPAVVEHLANPDRPLAHLSATARALLTLAVHTDAARVRRCAAPDCRRWFHDTSRNGSRKWCSMETCGNRAKAARFRARRADAIDA